jgi:hypothetical protein
MFIPKAGRDRLHLPLVVRVPSRCMRTDRFGSLSEARNGMASATREPKNRQAQRSDRRDIVLGRWVLDRHG